MGLPSYQKGVRRCDDRVILETDRHREAFEYWYSLGDKRTLTAVARKFEVSLQSVRKWARSFDWEGRLRKRQEEIAARVEEEFVKQEVERRKENLKIVDEAKRQFYEALKAGKIKFRTVQDFEILVRIEQLLLAEDEEDRDNPLAKLVKHLMELREDVDREAESEAT